MKALRALLCVVVGIVGFGPSLSRSEVDFEFFYDELSPYGAWVEVEDYGYCFRPWVDEGWRPYTDGYWADSDEGWVWVSNEPFGWLTYHYGRWAHTDLGWIWVPGYEWAPAWVSWRESEQYIGWAPLPPEVPWRPSTGIRFGISFGFGDVGPAYYNFCRPRYFGYPRLRDYLVPVQQNVNIIEQTTNITNITNVVNNKRTVIYNAGPNREFVRARSERPVRRLAIERTGENLSAAELRQRKLRNEVQGDRLRVVSPKVAKKDVTKPKKIAGRVEKRQIDDAAMCGSPTRSGRRRCGDRFASRRRTRRISEGRLLVARRGNPARKSATKGCRPGTWQVPESRSRRSRSGRRFFESSASLRLVRVVVQRRRTPSWSGRRAKADRLPMVRAAKM